jgi:uncharacterized protein
MMQTDWLWGLLGGGLIGSAGAMFLLLNGRIMGASGILGTVVDGTAGRNLFENIVFIAGLVGVPWLISLAWQGQATNVTSNIWAIVVGGVLVGLGTRLANGCTSGHGVCGISRLSRRGIAATLAYVGAGMIGIALFRHVWGLI